MRPLLVRPASCIRGQLTLLGDKSIASRSIIISAISRGKTRIENFPASRDCLATVNVLRKLGIRIVRQSKRGLRNKSSTVVVFGRGLKGLKKPRGNIFTGDSGTTLRLSLGVLAGQDFSATLTAGPSLARRPMLRVTAPLRMMGAKIKAKIKKSLTCSGRQGKSKIEEYPPITIEGGRLRPLKYSMPVASAQVKSAILLAGLYAKGITSVRELIRSRDHTERMLHLFKARIKAKGDRISVEGVKELSSPGKICIPGDISSAAFFMVLAAIMPHSYIVLKNIGLNPLRTGIVRVLKKMGCRIEIKNLKLLYSEPTADIRTKFSHLKGIRVNKKEIPSLIDELPVLMVAACYARGRTILEGVGELRLKETDRIRSMLRNLNKMGANIRSVGSGPREKIIIEGKNNLRGCRVKSFGDHRTAMSMVIAGLRAEGATRIDDVTCINKSFPNFLSLLRTIRD